MPQPVDLICDSFQLPPEQVGPPQVLQSLWSGYGKICRYSLHSNDSPNIPDSVIVKTITPQDNNKHPRGWNTNLSHQRKLRSYEVEAHWYQQWSGELKTARVARLLACDQSESPNQLLVLEDLDASGFPLRHSRLSVDSACPCLSWLAHLHGEFMQQTPGNDWQKSLWPFGCYWHLQTRPDELSAMEDGELKDLASVIDAQLHQCQFQTILHGDAKVANFCFSESGNEVAAVDFQYTGAGCGMKDVIYFLGSCLREDNLAHHWQDLLNHYFSELRSTLQRFHPHINSDLVEAEWRSLFPVAWADFERFLSGWEPNHPKRTGFSQRMTEMGLKLIRQQDN